MDEHRELWWPSASGAAARALEIPLAAPFETVLGGRIERLQVAYETWGTLDATRSNAVLVVHPLAMDCHVTGEFAGAERGWWEPLVGPGRAVDTERFCVVCPNLLGGCYGTTGPRFPAEDGRPWLARFPLLTPRDLMRAQRLFVQALGISRLHAVIGPSMGGMVVWEWAIEASDIASRAIVVAAPPRTTAYQIGWNWLQRRAIEADLDPATGAAAAGQALARGVGMLTYRASASLEQKSGRGWFKRPGSTLAEPGLYNVESWLGHHGRKAAKRFDPYTYLLFARAMDLHDAGEGRGGLETALAAVDCPVTAVGIDSDELYPASEVRAGIELLQSLGKPATYGELRSPHGHDAFLLETDALSEIVARALA